MPTLFDQYQLLTTSAGFADLGPRTQIEVAGNDRVAFLNNFCTADITALGPGSGAEAFVCNVKGKTLGHVFVYCGDDSLLIETTPGQADVLIGHLDRYIITEDVQLNDFSEGWVFLYVGGPQASKLLRPLIDSPLPERTLDFITADASGLEFAIGRGGPIGPDGYTICCRDQDADAVKVIFRDAGISEFDAQLLDALRIEAGMPLYGRDISDDNLPQEVNRNALAINLTKGCYLGQETVARIDALGHVNRLLVGLTFSGDTNPADGTELTVDGKTVGHVTSVAFSPRLDAPLALGYVRSAHAESGSRLDSSAGAAQVIELPLK